MSGYLQSHRRGRSNGRGRILYRRPNTGCYSNSHTIRSDATHQGYAVSTSSGSIEGEGLYFTGQGVAIFEGSGQFDSSSPAKVEEFTGSLSQTIRNNQSVTGTGTFVGNGILTGTLSDGSVPSACDANDTMPDDLEVCTSENGEIVVSGSVNATGRFVSAGQSEFIREYENASFTAAGRFVVEDGYSGTITGDGVFQGDGVFSGVMVREGTFHISNAIPGLYSVRIVMDTGQEIDVDEKFSILRTPSAETKPFKWRACRSTPSFPRRTDLQPPGV